MIAQLIANSLLSACLYGLVGLGFALVYTTSKFFHFAHGALFALAAYAAYMLVEWVGLSLITSCVGAILVVVVVACLLYFVVYSPLHDKGSGPLSLLIASLGMFTCIEAGLAVLFGADALVFKQSSGRAVVTVGGARLTESQFFFLAVGFSSVCASLALLKFTQLGSRIRALGNDAELAVALGIPKQATVLFVFVLATALAGVGAVFEAHDTGLVPTMGFRPLMMGIVALIIGGVGSVSGALIGGLIIGVVESFSVIWLPSQWQDGIVFFVLAAFLIFRPHGIAGKRPRKTAI